VPDLLTLVLADRPTGRPALVALAGALEASALAGQVELALARGPEAIAAAAQPALAERRPVAVAWSFFSAEVETVAAELGRVRELLPGVLQIAGGVHATAEPEATLELGFDLAARGEGEATVLGLAGKLLAGEDVRAVPGLAWRGRDGMATSGRAAAVRIDDHPGFSRRLGKAFALEVTRGCIWACRFCQTPFLHRAVFRHRSVEASRAFARFACAIGHRDIRFLTPSALSYGAEGTEVRLEAVEALLAAVREEIGPQRRIFFGTFPSELRPEHVSPEALALIKRYTDNKEVLVGGQSGSDRLLAAVARGHDAEAILRAVRYAREAGLGASVDFIVGLPGETPEDLAATQRLMVQVAEAGGRVHGHAFMPLPGTPWKREAPGRIDGETRLLLDRLASQGRAYGQWKRQVELGEALAQAKAGRP
jgi:B12-binding domain/radical SAM domain protein